MLWYGMVGHGREWCGILLPDPAGLSYVTILCLGTKTVNNPGCLNTYLLEEYGKQVVNSALNLFTLLIWLKVYTQNRVKRLIQNCKSIENG